MMQTNNNFPLVSIISVNYRQEQVSIEFLQSVFSISYPNYEVILVDNGSEYFPQKIKDKFPQVKIIVSKENKGFAGGNNLGIKEAKGDYLLFINNDTEVEPNFLEPLVKRMQYDCNIGMLSPKIIFFQDKKTIQYAGYTNLHPITLRNKTIGLFEEDKGHLNDACETAFAHGAAMMVPKKVIDKVGTMEESFFLYYEEFEWAFRIKKSGFSIWYEPNSVVYHKESVSTGKNSPLKTYYLNRNRLKLLKIHFKPFQVLISLVYLYTAALIKNLIAYALKKEWDNAMSLLKAYKIINKPFK